MPVIINLTILIIELAIIAAASWLAFVSPIGFGALTALIILAAGFGLERDRLHHDVPFYMDGTGAPARWRSLVFGLIAVGEAAGRALLAGAVAILTFAGKDNDRIMLLAVLFGVVTFFGSSLLRRMSRTFGVRPARWGYFRLAVPMGVLFSLAIQASIGLGMIKLNSLTEIARTIVFELPEKPNLGELTEVIFNIKQTLDALVRAFLDRITGPTYATAIGVIVSINVMSGLVISIYAVIAAQIVRKLEQHWLSPPALRKDHPPAED